LPQWRFGSPEVTRTELVVVLQDATAAAKRKTVRLH